jgi:hypothetical protein
VIRSPKLERQTRFAHKALDQVAQAQLQNDFDRSPFDSRAIVNMMHTLFESAWQSPAHLEPGQVVAMTIAAIMYPSNCRLMARCVRHWRRMSPDVVQPISSP